MPLGVASGGTKAVVASPAGPSCLMYRYSARKSTSTHCFSVNHGIGGRVFRSFAYFTHSSSFIFATTRRRLGA